MTGVAVVLGPPLVERGLAEVPLAPQLLDGQACLALPQEANDLLLDKSTLPYDRHSPV